MTAVACYQMKAHLQNKQRPAATSTCSCIPKYLVAKHWPTANVSRIGSILCCWMAVNSFAMAAFGLSIFLVFLGGDSVQKRRTMNGLSSRTSKFQFQLAVCSLSKLMGFKFRKLPFLLLYFLAFQTLRKQKHCYQ